MKFSNNTYRSFFVLCAAILAFFVIGKADAACFECRENYTSVEQVEVSDELFNVKCSSKTGGVLWWGDPFYGTVPMGDMPENIEADYLSEPAVVKPRVDYEEGTSDHLGYFPCSNCHGVFVPTPRSSKDRKINAHQDVVENSLELKHGRGAIWCLECHNAKKRDYLTSHRGDLISFNQTQKLCGKCHGQIYRDWRDGIHGKRIGYWDKGAKKRWWTCTECHNPHDVEPAFKALVPESAPHLPRGMDNADHERLHVDHSGLSHGDVTDGEPTTASHGEAATDTTAESGAH